MRIYERINFNHKVGFGHANRVLNDLAIIKSKKINISIK